MNLPAEIGPLLDQLAAGTARPFAPERIEALGQLSRAVLGDPELKRQAEAVALGYWLRPANIAAQRQEFETLARPGRVLVPAGLAFHVPPANVDTMGIYSWALSFLCGNASIIRLSQRSSPLTLRLVALAEAMLEANGMSDSTAFISYGHDTSITASISARADLRVIWGGDASIAAVRAVPLSTHAKEIVFADRLSLSALSASAWLGLDTANKADLASEAFNDLYAFDQMACSSPRILVWCGAEAEAGKASAGFAEALMAELARRGHETAPAVGLGKYAAACSAAIDLPSATIRFESLDWLTLQLAQPPQHLPQIGGGGGIAVELRLDRLADLAPFMDRRVQTITHFGFDNATLADFVEVAQGRGGDRLVPIGEALAFSPIWDGYDLFREFTRIVEIRS